MDWISFLLLPSAFFLIATVYAAVGLGGGSAYLALLALAGLPYETIPPTALLLNVIVAGISFLSYRREGYFSPRLLLPFALTSIPAAFLGGLIPVSERAFAILLSAVLVLAALRIFVVRGALRPRRSGHWILGVGLPIGALLGLLAGIVGFGGGIFLSPVLLLGGWAGAKEAAATTSAFVALNSISGLLARSFKGLPTFSGMEVVPLLALAVFLGGQLGSQLGSRRLSPLALQRIFALLLLAAAAKLLKG